MVDYQPFITLICLVPGYLNGRPSAIINFDICLISGRISFPEQISETYGGISFIAHTHPLEGVDVLF